LFSASLLQVGTARFAISLLHIVQIDASFIAAMGNPDALQLFGFAGAERRKLRTNPPSASTGNHSAFDLGLPMAVPSLAIPVTARSSETGPFLAVVAVSPHPYIPALEGANAWP
jgi:hypothetical protein